MNGDAALPLVTAHGMSAQARESRPRRPVDRPPGDCQGLPIARWRFSTPFDIEQKGSILCRPVRSAAAPPPRAQAQQSPTGGSPPAGLSTNPRKLATRWRALPCLSRRRKPSSSFPRNRWPHRRSFRNSPAYSIPAWQWGRPAGFPGRCRSRRRNRTEG